MAVTFHVTDVPRYRQPHLPYKIQPSSAWANWAKLSWTEIHSWPLRIRTLRHLKHQAKPGNPMDCLSFKLFENKCRGMVGHVPQPCCMLACRACHYCLGKIYAVAESFLRSRQLGPEPSFEPQVLLRHVVQCQTGWPNAKPNHSLGGSAFQSTLVEKWQKWSALLPT